MSVSRQRGGLTQFLGQVVIISRRGRRRGSGDEGGSREQMEGSEYELNEFLFDYHLIFDFLFIANCDPCDGSIT